MVRAEAKPSGSKGNATGGPKSGTSIAADPATVERIGNLVDRFGGEKPLKWQRNEPGWTPLEICESSAFVLPDLWEGEGKPDRPGACRSESQETCHSSWAFAPTLQWEHSRARHGGWYGFTFDEVINEGDTEVKKEGVKLLIDPMSFQYLTGAEIDYTEGLEGSQFVIRNPNATTTCGCGSSFSV